MSHPLSLRIAAVLDLDPDGRAIEYEDRWFSWAQLGATSRAVADTVGPGAQVGILLRNSPAHVAALLGVLLAGGLCRRGQPVSRGRPHPGRYRRPEPAR